MTWGDSSNRLEATIYSAVTASNQPVTAARLYNLAADVGETQDLAAAMPDKVKELQSRWDAWNVANVKPLWGGGRTDNDGAEPGAPVPKKGKRAKSASDGN